MQSADKLLMLRLEQVSPIVVATHPRSGTHLMIDALRWRAPECRVWKLPFEPLERVYSTTEELVPARPTASKLAVLSTLLRASRPLVKTHRLPHFERWYLPPRHDPLEPTLAAVLERRAKTVHVHRDGRAAIWSYYLLSRRSGALRGLTFRDFLRIPSSASPWQNAARSWAMHVRAWLAEGDVLSVAFAELTTAPDDTLSRVAARLELAVESRVSALPPRLGSVHDYLAARRPAGQPPSTAVLAPDWRLPPRSWREVFSREDGRFFERETEGLLVQLGYASAHDWWMELD